METLDIAAFKHVVVPIGVVIGLGVARMITTASRYVQHRERVRFTFAHALWSAVVFLMFVGLWWISWGLRTVEAELWTYFTLIFLLVGPCFLYLASTILLPDLPDDGKLDLGERLTSGAPAFFGALIGVLAWLLLTELWLEGDPLLVFPKRILQASQMTLFAIGAAFPSERTATVLGAISLPLLVVGLSTVRGELG